MKKILLLIVLVFAVLAVKSQDTLDLVVDTVTITIWNGSMLQQSEFEIYDTLNFNQAGNPNEIELSKWFCVGCVKQDTMKSAYTENNYQYKVNGQGVRSKRNIMILYEPEIILVRTLIKKE